MIRERIESVRHVGPSKASLVVLAVQFALSFGFCSEKIETKSKKSTTIPDNKHYIYL